MTPNQFDTALKGINQDFAAVNAMPFPKVPTPRPFDWYKAMHEAAADGAIVDERAFYLEEYHE